MKRFVCVILVALMIIGGSVCSIVPGAAVARARDFETESGVDVIISPYLYKTKQYTMKFPKPGEYATKLSSTPGDYAIPGNINDLSYTFVFPAGTTKVECTLSLDGKTNWRGFNINAEKNPNYWEKNEDGSIDLTKPLNFVRRETTAEQDEYGVLYRDFLWNKDVEGFRDYDKIYWKLIYTCNDEEYTDYFDIDVYDYDALEKQELTAVNLNVAGLPWANTSSNQKYFANYFSENKFDIVAVQEDFTFHKALSENMTDYKVKTNHLGGVPGGDGLNIFTRDMTIYNETRVAWEESFGVLAHGADELTPKGFVYTVIDVGNGIYIDFYNLHADAYGDAGSQAARVSQFRQIADFIKARSAENNRPVIVTGDFNTYMHNHESDGALYNTFCVELGLRDAWVEAKNKGDYFNFYEWHISGDSPWGNWDSVERFMYKGGGGVELVVDDFRFVEVVNNNGKNISDHSAAECDFTLIKLPDFEENTQSLEVAEDKGVSFTYRLHWFFKALDMILAHLDELPLVFEK